jgi:type IV pilus assembly protein PilY1
MKTPDHPYRTLRARPLSYAVALTLSIYSINAWAQTGGVAFPPMPLTVSTSVPPNLLYIHDDSNSMQWSFMPDDIHRYIQAVGNSSMLTTAIFDKMATYRVPFEFYMSPDFNKAYYNPAFNYLPPPAPPGVAVIDADGRNVTDGTLGNAKYTAAWYNGYDLTYRNSSGSYISGITRRVNLATEYIPTDFWSAILGSSFGDYYNPVIGTARLPGEFLPVAKGAASYWRCPAEAWAGYPTPTTTAANYKLNLCTKHTITTDAEKQNFANWYAYYRTRNYASKAGIGRAFEQLDPSIRVGWGLINKRASVVDGKSVTTVQQGVRPFDRVRKTEFLNWLYKIQPEAATNSPVFVNGYSGGTNHDNGTPLRKALDGAGQYYDRSTGNLGPWADNPASPRANNLETAAACRKSFTILMTDGYWNGLSASTAGANGNADGAAGYPFSDGYAGTLADVAWYYWSKKLVPGDIDSKVPKTPYPGTTNRYHDNATWQHMNTFTIGLGVEGRIRKELPFRAMQDPSAGTINWPNPALGESDPGRVDDLLHAAVNGHGDFFSASNPDEFVTGMQSIINSVNSVQRLFSGKLEANTTDTAKASGRIHIYKSSYKPSDWSGELTAHDPNTASTLSELGAEVWRASEQMPTPASRRIYTRSNNVGATFLWGNLDSTQQVALGGMMGGMINTVYGQQVLDFIRGSGSNEGRLIGQFRERTRSSTARAPLGDSPHNAPVYVKYSDAEMVFLGANDGMLHAFDATDGAERFAYVPAAVIPNLPMLTASNGYSVDGEILVTTPSQTPGKYLLVGALGRGGKALYGLDVTRPKAFAAADVRWEINGNNCFDLNLTPKYIGNILGGFSYIEIGGTPSAAFGNGYNSCNGKAALGIVNVETGSLNFIKASDDLGNGLAAPMIWSVPGSDKTFAYAGDLLGKLWKFDMKTLGAPIKLFDAGASKPITSRVTAAVLGDNQNFIFFGTGRYLAVTDKSTTTQQSFYGLIDKNYDTVIPATDLQLRTFGPAGVVGGATVRSVIPLPGNSHSSKKGWMLDLIEPGERVVNPPIIYSTQDDEVIIFTTITPPAGGDSCSPKGSGYTYLVDAQTGSALDSVLVDLNGDGKFDERDTLNGAVPSAIKFDIGMLGAPTIVDGKLIICAQDSSDCIALKLRPTAKPQSGRILWREITD